MREIFALCVNMDRPETWDFRLVLLLGEAVADPVYGVKKSEVLRQL